MNKAAGTISVTISVMIGVGLLLTTGCTGAAPAPTATPTIGPATKGAPVRTVRAMFRANPQHTGVYETKGLDQLTGLRWKFKTGHIVFSSPVVADGVVYVGSQDGYLYAVDADTGQQKWRSRTGDLIRWQWTLPLFPFPRVAPPKPLPFCNLSI